jgi:hypothetical protein
MNDNLKEIETILDEGNYNGLPNHIVADYIFDSFIVSKQRKLLKFFAEKWNPDQTTGLTIIDDEDIEKCINSFNCK